MAYIFPHRIKESTFVFENLLEKNSHRFSIKYLPRAKNDNIHTNRNILNMLSKTNKLLIFIRSNKAWRQKAIWPRLREYNHSNHSVITDKRRVFSINKKAR